MALPNGLAQVSDLGALQGSLGYNIVDIPLMTPTTASGSPAAGTFHSSITNRAPMYDLRKDLSVNMGINRINTQQAYQLQDEFGPNGEPVWGDVNDVYNQIRFVGSWLNLVDNDGPRLFTATANSYVEITFYGTGLNLLSSAATGTKDIRATINGGAEGGTTVRPTVSLLGQRQYLANVVCPVASNLTLGIYTVRLRFVSGNFDFNGFEALNESSSIKVNPGTSWKNGQKLYNAAQALLSYNSGFESGTLGTRGGRIAVYQKPDGSIAKAVNSTGSQLNLAAADHSNEEVARVYFYREFGAGRTADDFSTLTNIPTRSGAFTLDDGTTTLTATNVAVFNHGIGDGLNANGTPSDLSIIFVGTGLDFVNVRNAAQGATYTITVNGTTILTASATIGGTGFNNTVKVVSGLPYGTHVVKISASVIGPVISFSKFIVYQPKTPTIPSDASLIGTYNIMANYDSSTITGTAVTDNTQMPIGCLYKAPMREFTYVGANQQFFPLDTISLPGLTTTTLTNNTQPTSYTFFGTGFVLHLGASIFGTYDFTVSVDGALNATGVARSNASNLGGGSYRSTASANVYQPVRIEFTGLTLGTHTVSFQRTAGAGNITFQGLHIITPIHSPKNNGPFVLQNTLPIGSQSVGDSRLLASQINSKNTSQAVGVTSSPSTSSMSPVPCPDMSVIHTNKSGKIMVAFQATMRPGAAINANENRMQIYINGFPVARVIQINSIGANGNVSFADNQVFSVSPGTNKIDVYWYVNASTLNGDSINRSLTVEEVD